MERNLERYHQARSKLDKSIIVIEIVDEIRSRAPHGGFIQQRKDRSDGKKVWIEIGDTLARAKVGHALRDAVRNTSCHSALPTTILAFQHSASSVSSSSSNSDNDDEEDDVDTIDLTNNETAWTSQNEGAIEKNSNETRRHVYDASELLRMSLISISDPSPFDEQLLSDDEECSQNSFDCDISLTSFQAFEIEDLLFADTFE